MKYFYSSFHMTHLMKSKLPLRGNRIVTGNFFSIKSCNHIDIWYKLLHVFNYKEKLYSIAVQFSQSCLTLCDPMDCSTLGFPVHHQLPELLKLMSTELVMQSNHLILCHPLLLLPSVPEWGSFPMSQFFTSGRIP